jgi:1-acyl-sn-glycerol-3-phosphate acyltransferase
VRSRRRQPCWREGKGGRPASVWVGREGGFLFRQQETGGVTDTARAVVVEPFRSRWKRRAQTIPVMLGITVAAMVALPMIVAVAIVVDLARFRLRLPTLRVALFALQYGFNDSVEIVLAPVYWIMAGFGTRLRSGGSVHRHERLQAWSVAVLARRAERLLGLCLAVGPEVAGVLEPGPVIVLCRHVNVVDASLPTLLYQRLGYRTRGVIMAELLADPGFDLIYGRTGSVFIPRDNGPEAQALISQVGRDVDATTAVVIFPEGRLFRPEGLQRSLGRLAESNPDRAGRLAGLRHLLPPRPGGVSALLDALPQADVVVLAHAGLDRYPSFRSLAAAVPVPHPIRVTAWRIRAADIPADPAERTAWLDDQWLLVDRWVSSNLASGGWVAARRVSRGA